MGFSMKTIPSFVLLFFLVIFSSNGQERYTDSIFSEIAINTFYYVDTLGLDFYSPKNDTIENRPLLMLVHGGGFSSGKRDNPLEKEFCIAMAQKGYAVTSISYRLVRKGKGFGCDCPAKDKIETFRLASEDIIKACKFLIDKPSLNFDAKKIILVGSSAGAEGVLNTIFMRNHPEFKDLPYDDLTFAGVISFSGAVLDADYISKSTVVPTFLIHGAEDNLVPFGTAPHHFCDENAEGYLILDGPKTITKKIAALDKPYILMEDPKGNHDWANLGYSYTKVISEFINKVILEGENQQTKVLLGAKK